MLSPRRKCLRFKGRHSFVRVTSSVYRITKKKKHKEERDMKKIMTFVAIATLAAFCLACSKEIDNSVTNQPQEKTAIEGSTVYLNIGLSEDTKISHDLDGITIKPRWESTDALKVTFTVSGAPVEETFNIDASSISADGRSARFYKDDSQLASRDGYFDVAYAGNATDWSVQDGTYANLPEILVKTGLSSTDSPIALESQLTYFHFDLSTAANPAEALELANAYFYNNTHALIIDSSNNTGDIKITQTMTYTTGGVGANADFYVAAKLAADSYGDTFGIDLQNGDHYAGVQGYSLTWNAAKSYSTGAVYKKTSTAGTLTYNSGLVGATNNSSSYFTQFSDYFEINNGEQLHLELVNYTSKEANYHNWYVALTNDVLRGGAGYTEYGIIRADNYVNIANVSCDKCNYFTDGNWTTDSWQTFKNQMDGASVSININFSSASKKAFVSATATAANGRKYTETYTTAVLGETIHAFLTVEKSHLYVKKAWKESAFESFSVAPKAGISTTYYSNGTDDVLFDGNSVTVTAVKGDSTIETIESEVVNFSKVPAASGTQPVTVDFGGLAQKSINSTVISNSTVSAGLPDCSGFFNWGGGTTVTTVDSGTTETVKFMMYSGGRDNFNNAIILLQNNDGVEQCAVRLDDAFWNSNGSSATNSITRNNDWNWSIFGLNQNHSDVVLSITNTGTYVNVRYDVTYSDGTTKYQEYNNLIIGSEVIKYIITTEHSYIVLHS